MLSGANPGPESRTATSTSSESVFAVLKSNSRDPSLIALIASIPLINKLRIAIGVAGPGEDTSRMKERTIKRTQPTARGIGTIRTWYVKQGVARPTRDCFATALSGLLGIAFVWTIAQTS
jgi:hypothetical protein